MRRSVDDRGLVRRAALHAALGEPARLALVEELTVSDRSPKELAELFGIGSNLLAHHLDVLESVGVLQRSASAGDGRRKYVRLVPGALRGLSITVRPPVGEMLFLCTHNSARSQLAAAVWSSRTGRRAASAGTRPAPRVHRGAVSAAQRAGLSLTGAAPTLIDQIPLDAQVVTVCDLVHEELDVQPGWWHWSIPDPAGADDPAAFDAVVAELDRRIAPVARLLNEEETTR